MSGFVALADLERERIELRVPGAGIFCISQEEARTLAVQLVDQCAILDRTREAWERVRR